MEDDIYLRYFKYHYSQYQTVNNIGDNDTVEYEGKTLKIGWFKRSIRNKHSYYIKGENKRGSMTPLMLHRYEVLDSLNFVWTPQKNLTEDILTKDKYLRYLKQHHQKHGTINNIKYTDVVEFEGEQLKIGIFIKSIRAAHKDYELEIRKEKSHTKISLARYEVLNSLGFIWNTKDEYYTSLEEQDPYLDYLKEHYQKHGTINNISNRQTVEYNGNILRIGRFLKEMRTFFNNFNNERNYSIETLNLYNKRKKVLDSLSFEWTPKEKMTTNKLVSDPYLEFLKLYYKEHGTINDIPTSLEVTFNGQTLKIGEFLKSIRYNHKFYISGQKRAGVNTKIALNRYRVLDSLGFIWQPEKKQEYTAPARRKGLKPTTVHHLIKKFNGDIDKALTISLIRKKTRQANYSKKKKVPNPTNLEINFDMNEDFLKQQIRKRRTSNKKPKQILMYDENTTLAEYCLQNSYNYDVILRLINKRRNHQEDISLLIKECISEYIHQEQGKVPSYIYGKFDNEILAKHLLISIGLDYHAIFHDMTSNDISLEEAIKRETFRKTAKKEYAYLDGIFYNFIEFYHLATKEELNVYQTEMITNYHLSEEEQTIIEEAFIRYKTTIRKYQLADVGFEKEQDKMMQKIIDYNLTIEEVEEAFFIPLRFENKVLLGEESELAKRRKLLKELILNPTEEETFEQTKSTYNLTDNEITYIVNSRKTLTTIKQKVLKK